MALTRPVERSTVAAYVLPFAVFIGFLAVNALYPVPQWARFFIEIGLILAVSRQVLRTPPTSPVLSIVLGAAVFVVWIGPDVIYPAWRSLPLFTNAVTGHVTASTTLPQRHDFQFLTFRVLTSVVAVPILEELFWRGFMMRWLIGRDFRAVPLGAWSAEAFWIVALLFASEHGPYWDVGLITGVIYNWWMLRTRNLWDCIIAHAVTNACLAAWVIGAGQWQYWL